MEAIRKLHVSLRTLKNNLKVSAKTTITPALDNDTRWSSGFKMLTSYLEILPVLESCNLDSSTRALFPGGVITESARELLEFLKCVQSISMTLQSVDYTTNNLYTARLLFDKLIADFPAYNLAAHLGPNADIIHNKAFESAIIKLQAPIHMRLTHSEAEAVKVFKIDASTDGTNEGQEEEHNEGYAQSIIREDTEKALKKQKKAEYRSVKHVASNSNRCERLFSGTKLVMTDQRKCMDPSTLEMVTMLDENSDLWSAYDVQDVGNALKRGGAGRGLAEEDEVPIYESDSDDDGDQVVGEDAVDLAVDIHLADDI